MFCEVACASSHYYTDASRSDNNNNNNHLLPKVIPPGEAPNLLLAARSLLGDPDPAVRDDVESIPRGALPHNVLA